MIVVDASIATKLIIREIDSRSAEHWYADAKGEIIAPDLIVIEVSQAVVRRVNARIIPDEAGRAALLAWRTILDGGGITLFKSDTRDVHEAAQLAIELGHPIKDCLYLHHAIELDAVLMTADAKFRIRALRLHPRIELLDQLQ